MNPTTIIYINVVSPFRFNLRRTKPFWCPPVRFKFQCGPGVWVWFGMCSKNGVSVPYVVVVAAWGSVLDFIFCIAYTRCWPGRRTCHSQWFVTEWCCRAMAWHKDASVALNTHFPHRWGGDFRSGDRRGKNKVVFKLWWQTWQKMHICLLFVVFMHTVRSIFLIVFVEVDVCICEHE